MPTPSPHRTDRLRRLSRPLVTPLAQVLARLSVPPNAVTLLGLAVTAGAAVVIARGDLLWGGVILLAGSALDAVDGELARLSGKASAFGAFLDSTIDRLGEAVVFLGLLAYFTARQDQAGSLLTLAALASSFLVSYTRARAESLGYHGEAGFMARPVRVIVLGLGLVLQWPRIALGIIAVLGVVTGLQRSIAVWRQAREQKER